MSEQADFHARLKELLTYEPETGFFRWRVTGLGKVIAGKRAGSSAHQGYRAIRVLGKKHKEHRLVWFYMTGAWPTKQIDHRNGIRSDNRWSNLRDVGGCLNQHNTGMRKNNRSGFKGVFWSARAQKWQAAIVFSGKRHHLGFFDDACEAGERYAAKRAELLASAANVN